MTSERETYRNEFKNDIQSLAEEEKIFLMKFVDWVYQKN